MTAAEGSFIGLAKQTAKGTPNTTDASFEYLLFTRGAFGPNNIFLPLPPEVGGGSLQRGVIKAGVNSGGAAEFIPRPGILGHLLYGVTGKYTYTADTPSAGWNQHEYELDNTDEFAAPYYTYRFAPGNLWGEQLQDCRTNLVTLNFEGANFVSGSFGALGGLPTKVSTAAWGAAAKVDNGPQFIAPVSDIEVPTSTNLSVLSGSFAASAMIPLDEQYVVGAYVPEGLDIVHRTFVLSLAVKISDATLYTKMMYDPASGNNWAAEMFREADIKIDLVSDVGENKISIEANGQTAASGDANIYWSATPLALRAQRQIIMAMTGIFTATSHVNGPIKITLINDHAQY